MILINIILLALISGHFRWIHIQCHITYSTCIIFLFFFFFFNPFYVHRSEYAQVRDEQANLSSNSDVNAIVHQSVNSLSTMSRMFN